MDISTENFVNDLHSWLGETVGLKTVKALRKNNFDAEYFNVEETLVNKVLSLVKPGDKVAFGGSQTVKQLSIPEMVRDLPATILDHNAPGLSVEDKMEIMRQQQVCDVFICSANAITIDGQIFNVDGNGNRVSAMIFGPKKVIVIAGTNKICHDEAAAWERMRSTAAPINMKRLNRDTPCVTSGYCSDCSSNQRGCNAYLILKRKPTLTDFLVFIFNKSLGF
jgi:hypothetical protein